MSGVTSAANSFGSRGPRKSPVWYVHASCNLPTLAGVISAAGE